MLGAQGHRGGGSHRSLRDALEPRASGRVDSVQPTLGGKAAQGYPVPHSAHDQKGVLRRLGRAPLQHGLEKLQMGWSEIEPALLPRIGMGGAKGLRVRPGLESRRTVPGGM
jgi:hypothetical protein